MYIKKKATQTLADVTDKSNFSPKKVLNRQKADMWPAKQNILHKMQLTRLTLDRKEEGGGGRGKREGEGNWSDR